MPSNLPGEAVGNKAIASGRGPPLPSDAIAALCAWKMEPSVLIPGRKVPHCGTFVKCEGQELAESVGAVREVPRLMQRSCGSAQSQTPPVLTSSPGGVRACSSKVSRERLVYPCPQFLQALWVSR